MPLGNPSPKIVLVTPVWNDSARLAVFGKSLAAALAGCEFEVRWIISDDGSGLDEHAALSRLREEFALVYPHVEIHFAAAHLGKGGVVREAWALVPDADWLAFVDADGSVSGGDMLGLIRHAMRCDDSVLGIRKRTADTQIVESPWRGIAHRGFLMAARLLLDLRCEDPQCGAKVIRGVDYRRIVHRLVENGLAFDSELLATLARADCSWQEVPVTWIEKKGGKVKPLRDAWGMLRALVAVRSNLG